MRWPWRRGAETGERTPADEAVEISERQRQRAVERRREFASLAARMRRMREVNHLAEAFHDAFLEGR